MEVFEQGGVVLLAVVAGDGELVPNGTVELEAFVERRHRLSSIQAWAIIALYGINSVVLAVEALS